jgi:UDP-N-acetylglucosamine--N-acetylmuramyl-(pentapeptide) pyrophosphoryl-undecaprenol N-acetylglucosamine transferase
MSTLLVASGGGHLKQLHRLLPRLGITGRRTWVTFDTGLSRSLLEGEDVHFAPYAHPHDLKGTVVDLAFAARLLARLRREGDPVGRAVSTGANLAVAFLPIARLQGATAQYIESATRSAGPSYTGRILQRVPGIDRYTQHPAWADRRWHYGGSVFDGFCPVALPHVPSVRRMVVTLGSNDSYRFPRLVERLRSVVPGHVEVLWQLGSTFDAVDLPEAHRDVPAVDLEAAMRDADVVVAHAGTGAALSAMECGNLPLLVPRRSAFGEHVDDHQELTATTLRDRGLASSVEVDDLTWHDVAVAASWRVEERTDLPPFRFT